MSAASHGAACGVVLGIVFVLLAQEFGYLDLTDLVSTLIYLVIAIVVGAVLFGLIGMALGRAYLAKNPPGSSSGG